jgi:hypothetical protein
MKRNIRCPRCGGALFLSREDGAMEWACLLCARTYHLDLQPVRQAPTAPPEREAARRAA